MNKEEVNNLFHSIQPVSAVEVEKIEVLLNEFPYFQAARAIQLKGLKNTNSYKYNNALKKTAAYTIDRKVLFHFITQTESNFETKTVTSSDISELHEEISVLSNQDNPEIIQNTFIEEPEPEISIKNAEEKLEIGAPIQFDKSESFSFNEWLQLSTFKKIDRQETPTDTEENHNKFDLIDKFIETNPKIKPTDKSVKNIDIAQESLKENQSLMTETLAKVYLEQKKYDNAIQAYHILSLKYPEKSSFFADRIKAIKILQRNKS